MSKTKRLAADIDHEELFETNFDCVDFAEY